MLSPPPLKPAVPSASLLRYLRSQSENTYVFTSACGTSRKPRVHNQPSRMPALRNASSWAYITPLQCRATLQTNLPTISRSRGSPRCRATLDQSPPPITVFSRATHTKSRPLLRRLFDLRRSKVAAVSKLNRTGGPALVDEGTEGLNFGRGLAAKASNELRLRCTEFDNNGNVTLVNGEFRKSELIAKVGNCPSTERLRFYFAQHQS